MHVQVACLLCSIDPGTANMMLPIAQATIITAPILLRDQIRRGIQIVRERRRGGGDEPTGCERSNDALDAASEETTDR